ncbi:MAG: GerMN domain-containing protein [Clostridiales bacterium]|nr:GerMN domain-containing protein [Clostridiales bacterium]
MSKGLITILLVIIIAYSLSFIPLNNELINFDFIDKLISKGDEPIDETPIDEKVYTYDFYLEDHIETLENPNLITIIIETNDIEYTLNNNLQFNLYQDNILIDSFIQDNILVDVYDNITTEKNQKKITIDISLGNLEIEPGEYQIKILSDDSNLIDKEILLSLDYLEEYDYVGSTNNVASGKEYIELYFADQDYLYLLPVSRLIDSTNGLIREMINNQFEGPTDSSGLFQGQIGPWSYAAYTNGSTLEINYHSADVKPYGIGSSAAMFAVDSIVNSMTSISYINDVQFYVDEKNAGYEYFHGMVLDEPVKQLSWPKLYYGLKSSNNRIYLNPVQIYELDYKDVFSALQAKSDTIDKYSIPNIIEDSNTIVPIPKSIELLDIELNGKTLTINLSDNAQYIYGSMEKNYQMMIDSILYS